MRMAFCALLVAAKLYAQESGIQDNSFLMEEAYNQESGIVQHMFTHQTNWSVHGSGASADGEFTQEWPVWGQTVQGSYTLPVKTPFRGADLHVRYQVLQEATHGVAFAPRFSFLLHYDNELNLKNMLGYQVNLPFSKDGYKAYCPCQFGVNLRSAAAERHNLLASRHVDCELWWKRHLCTAPQFSCAIRSVSLYTRRKSTLLCDQPRRALCSEHARWCTVGIGRRCADSI
jgi:hypothetical protein